MAKLSSAQRRFGLGWVVAGLLLFLVSRLLDGGFVGGLFVGAAIGTLLVGVVVLASAGRGGGNGAAGWLPSRDGDRR